MSEVMDFINSAGSGFDSFQFDNVGDTIDGHLVNEPRIIEKANSKTGLMDKILVLDIHTANDQDWVLMCGLGGRITAIREALQNANAAKLEVGGRLVLKYTANAPKKPGQPQPAKLYAAAYVPPAASNGVTDLLGATTPPAAPVAVQAAPAAAPAAAPTSVDDLLR